MLPDEKTPFELTAITLRGVGSYLRGARLEIRPLTILCGKNGSGKSTWLKALNLLSRSLEANRLPFAFDDASRELAEALAALQAAVAKPNYFDADDAAAATLIAPLLAAQGQKMDLLSAFYYRADPVDQARVANPDDARLYGPPGTIGLEFKAVADVALGCENDNTHDRSATAPRFLWSGQCAAGTCFRVRLAHPSYSDDNTATPELWHAVELCLDGKFVISMTGERDPNEKFEAGNSRPTRSKPYELSCSAAFLPGADGTDGSVLRLATVFDLVQLRCHSLSHLASPSLAIAVIEHFEKRLQQILRLVLGGYFYIGGVRQPYTAQALTASEGMASRLESRHVGVAGEHAWWLERHFATNLMREGRVEAAFQPEECPCSIQGLFYFESPREKRIDRIWELGAAEPKETIERLLAEQKAWDDAWNLAKSVGGDAERAWEDEWDEWRESHFD